MSSNTVLRTTAAQRRPSISSMKSSRPLISHIFQQMQRLIERQADDAGIGTAHIRYHSDSLSLDCIAPGLAAPLVGMQVKIDFRRGQAFELYDGGDEFRALLAIGCDQRHGAKNPVAATGKKLQAIERLFLRLRLGE